MSRKKRGPSAPLCGTPLVGWVNDVVPTSFLIAYRRLPRYACRTPWNERRNLLADGLQHSM